jgi:hypothetical protein
MPEPEKPTLLSCQRPRDGSAQPRGSHARPSTLRSSAEIASVRTRVDLTANGIDRMRTGSHPTHMSRICVCWGGTSHPRGPFRSVVYVLDSKQVVPSAGRPEIVDKFGSPGAPWSSEDAEAGRFQGCGLASGERSVGCPSKRGVDMETSNIGRPMMAPTALLVDLGRPLSQPEDRPSQKKPGASRVF